MPIQPNKKKHLHLITSLKQILKRKQDIPLQTNNLRDPTLRTGGLDPGNLKIGFDVVFSFVYPIYQNRGPNIMAITVGPIESMIA